jgi:hypothetical protein
MPQARRYSRMWYVHLFLDLEQGRLRQKNAKISDQIPVKQLEASIAERKAKRAAEPNVAMHRMMLYTLEYSYSKYVRGDNTPEFAKSLGYLDANELYPDFKPITFKDFVKELLNGKAHRPYPALSL